MSGSADYALLVEDDQDVGALLRHHLEALEYAVVHVLSGEEALDRIAESSPAVAVVDILLPGIDGRAVIRQLRTAPAHAACRVVLASIVDVDDLDVDVDAVLTKPFRRADVARALQRAGARPGGGAA